jgi:hypothetical protein
MLSDRFISHPRLSMPKIKMFIVPAGEGKALYSGVSSSRLAKVGSLIWVF